MAWTHIQTFAPEALPRVGWFQTRHQVTDGSETRCEFWKWDHSPTAGQRTAAVTAILNKLNNPPAPNTRPSDIKAFMVNLRDRVDLTNAQKMTALSNYIDTIVGAD